MIRFSQLWGKSRCILLCTAYVCQLLVYSDVSLDLVLEIYMIRQVQHFAKTFCECACSDDSNSEASTRDESVSLGCLRCGNGALR